MKNTEELKFLGRGSAFNYEEDNTSAYLILDKTLYLFDCGEKIASKMISLHLFDNMEKAVIFITHMHSDHIGSLEPLLTYLEVFRKDISVTVIYPQYTILKDIMTKLFYRGKADFTDHYEDDRIKTEITEAHHIPYSYSYYFYSEPLSFFYSGDTCVFCEEAYQKLKEGNIDFLYHEVANNQSTFHTGIDTINEKTDPALRDKIVLMHFENKELMNKVLKAGYRIAIAD